MLRASPQSALGSTVESVSVVGRVQKQQISGLRWSKGRRLVPYCFFSAPAHPCIHGGPCFLWLRPSTRAGCSAAQLSPESLGFPGPGGGRGSSLGAPLFPPGLRREACQGLSPAELRSLAWGAPASWGGRDE